MKIGALIIGDEILSGKRRDQHFHHLQTVLAQRGLELNWTVICGDDASDLCRFLSLTLHSEDLVFSFGGIGATPDDRTRQAVAKAAQVPLERHPEAVAEIEAQYGNQAYPHRILMAELPKGSTIIPNPVNRVPGFSFEHHHFMPGFPDMAWPMIEWVLNHHYPDLYNTRPEAECTIFISQARESVLIDTMTTILAQYPQLQLSSLPHLGPHPYIEFSLRGKQHDIIAAMAIMTQFLDKQGYPWAREASTST